MPPGCSRSSASPSPPRRRATRSCPPLCSCSQSASGGCAGGRAAAAARVAAVAGVAASALPAGTWVVAARSLHRPTVNQVTTATDTDTGVPLKARNTFNVQGFISYVRQFSLPNPKSNGALFPSTLPVYGVCSRAPGGVFGWRQLRLPPLAFFVLAVLSLAAL